MAKDKKSHSQRKLSRREFARGVTLAAIVSSVPGVDAGTATPCAELQPQPTSPEAEAQFQAIIRKHGAALSEEQRADIRRLLEQAQKTSEALRNFPLDNSDEPAMIFHIYRPDKASLPTTRRRK